MSRCICYSAGRLRRWLARCGSRRPADAAVRPRRAV